MGILAIVGLVIGALAVVALGVIAWGLAIGSKS